MNPMELWGGCLGYLDAAFAGSAVVGYEAGDMLAAAAVKASDPLE